MLASSMNKFSKLVQDIGTKAGPTDLSKFTARKHQSEKWLSGEHLLHILDDGESYHDRDEENSTIDGSC